MGSFLNKKLGLIEENKNESSRGMIEKKETEPSPFSLKDHFKEEELPHFGTSEIESKSQPDLFMNKSFHFTSNYKATTIENERTPKHDEKIADQSVNSCLICFDKLPNAVFMDCGHGG